MKVVHDAIAKYVGREVLVTVRTDPPIKIPQGHPVALLSRTIVIKHGTACANAFLDRQNARPAIRAVMAVGTHARLRSLACSTACVGTVARRRGTIVTELIICNFAERRVVWTGVVASNVVCMAQGAALELRVE